jgi:hypothetical protein
MKALKPVTDEQVLYDKFLYGEFYLPSAHVYVQQIFYEKFLYGEFYLPSVAYMCMCDKFSMRSFYMASFICQVYMCMSNKFSMTSFWFTDRHDSYYYPLYNNRSLTNCMQVLRLLCQVFFVDPYRRAKFVL